MATIARGAKAGGGTNYNSGETIDPDEVNTDFNTVYTEINGNLDDANIETGTIPGAKTLRFTEISTPSAPASNTMLLYSADSDGRTVMRTTDSAGTSRTLMSSSGARAHSLVIKNATETVNGSSVLQDDDELLIALEASESVVFTAVLRYTSGTTPDIKFAWTVPAATTSFSWAPAGGGRWVAAGTFGQTDEVAVSGTALDFMGTAGNTLIVLHGHVFNGVNAGNLQLQWAQNTSNASDTKVYAASYIQAWRQ